MPFFKFRFKIVVVFVVVVECELSEERTERSLHFGRHPKLDVNVNAFIDVGFVEFEDVFESIVTGRGVIHTD